MQIARLALPFIRFRLDPIFGKPARALGRTLPGKQSIPFPSTRPASARAVVKAKRKDEVIVAVELDARIAAAHAVKPAPAAAAAPLVNANRATDLGDFRYVALLNQRFL